MTCQTVCEKYPSASPRQKRGSALLKKRGHTCFSLVACSAASASARRSCSSNTVALAAAASALAFWTLTACLHTMRTHQASCSNFIGQPGGCSGSRICSMQHDVPDCVRKAPFSQPKAKLRFCSAQEAGSHLLLLGCVQRGLRQALLEVEHCSFGCGCGCARLLGLHSLVAYHPRMSGRLQQHHWAARGLLSHALGKSCCTSCAWLSTVLP